VHQPECLHYPMKKKNFPCFVLNHLRRNKVQGTGYRAQGTGARVSG
jgi:hypothetical protein